MMRIFTVVEDHKGNVKVVPKHHQDAHPGRSGLANHFLQVDDAASDGDLESETPRREDSLTSLWPTKGGAHAASTSLYPLQPRTGDGLVFALVSTRDHLLQRGGACIFDDGIRQEVLQLFFSILLHAIGIILQLAMIFLLWATTVEELEDPFEHGLEDKMIAIRRALASHPPVPLSVDDPLQNETLRLCKMHHHMHFVHVIVLFLWGARMVVEASEILNRLAITTLIPEPNEDEPCIVYKDNKAVIAYLDRPLRHLIILIVTVPRIVATVFLAWTGGKLFMFTHVMSQLIIPLLTLTYMTTVPNILFRGFTSLKLKEHVGGASYQFHNGLCYASKNCQMWGLTTIKLTVSVCFVVLIYNVVFKSVTEYRSLCGQYFDVFPPKLCWLLYDKRCGLAMLGNFHE
mmetsp:Transcript_34908/g.97984  ORF Transcript_34908/g.97984 Transcript_34908/m.97984 type:complete len:402 (+) Transcript_34908:39-1244(+)